MNYLSMGLKKHLIWKNTRIVCDFRPPVINMVQEARYPRGFGPSITTLSLRVRLVVVRCIPTNAKPAVGLAVCDS